MQNFYKRTFSRVQVPGIVVERAEFWLADPGNPVFSVTDMRTHALSLWKTASSGTRMWSRPRDSGEYLPQGHLGYLPANVPWDVHVAGSGPAQNIVCYFDPDHFRTVTGSDQQRDSEPTEPCRGIDSPTMTRTLWQLNDELCTPGLGSEIVVESLGRLLMIEIARHFQGLRAQRSAGTQRLAAWQMNRIREYIETRSGERVTVQTLAEICGVSVGYLHRVFKDSTGQTLGAYVEQLRTEKAKALLSEGRLTLRQIAEQLGFCDANSFSAAFRRATGEPPKRFQRRVRS